MRLHGWREYRDSLGAPVRLRIITRAEIAAWERWAQRRRFTRRVVAICFAVLWIVGVVLLARRGWR